MGRGIETVWRTLWAALTVNDVTAGSSEAYPGLQPPVVTGPKNRILEDSQEVFEELGPLWSLDEIKPEEGLLTGTVQTPWLKFVDNFEVRLQPATNQENPAWEVVARSRSRIGKGDLGKNARNIRRFYRTLQKKCPGERWQSGSRPR